MDSLPVPATIQAFLDFQRVNSIKENTLTDQRSKLKIANEWKPLVSWKKDDVTKYIVQMKEKGYADSYVEMTKALLKKFFKFHKKEKFVEDLRVKMPRRKLRPSDILTPDDVDKLIAVAPDNMQKALIALMFESGARINELLNIRVKDLQDTEKGLKVLIPATKTGEDYRPCLCVASGQYVRNHILYPPLKPEDKLFPISDSVAWRKLKDIAKKTDIQKPISAHKFRHAQATYMVRKGYQESIIRAKLGWTDDSRMIAKYQHIDGEDVINAMLEKEGHGQTVPRELVQSIRLADPIAIADKSLELNRLHQENEQLRHDYDELKSRTDRLEAYLTELEYWETPKKA